jgi:hypothetical protein
MARRTLGPAKRARIDEAVREMFAALSDRPVPGRLLSVLDQLEDEEAPAPRKTRRQRG